MNGVKADSRFCETMKVNSIKSSSFKYFGMTNKDIMMIMCICVKIENLLEKQPSVSKLAY